VVQQAIGNCAVNAAIRSVMSLSRASTPANSRFTSRTGATSNATHPRTNCSRARSYSSGADASKTGVALTPVLRVTAP
jgi:hypothetical protein